MLTLDLFNQIPDGEIFACGYTIDNENGCNMTGNGQLLRWIAKKGGGNDWAIYIHLSEKPLDWIKQHGDKVTMKDNIMKLVNCSEEMLGRYRK